MFAGFSLFACTCGLFLTPPSPSPSPVYFTRAHSQLQLTQRIPVPQDPVSIIVPIVYDMATGLTQQADIPRQSSSSGAAALLVSNILKRFNELHPPRQGKAEHSSDRQLWGYNFSAQGVLAAQYARLRGYNINKSYRSLRKTQYHSKNSIGTLIILSSCSKINSCH